MARAGCRYPALSFWPGGTNRSVMAICHGHWC